VSYVLELACCYRPAAEPFKVEAVELGCVFANAARYPTQQAVITVPCSHLVHLRSGLRSCHTSLARQKDGCPGRYEPGCHEKCHLLYLVSIIRRSFARRKSYRCHASNGTGHGTLLAPAQYPASIVLLNCSITSLYPIVKNGVSIPFGKLPKAPCIQCCAASWPRGRPLGKRVGTVIYLPERT
jgi:hypothetical protein